MSYLKLKKQNGAFDLVPCDNIAYMLTEQKVLLKVALVH